MTKKKLLIIDDDVAFSTSLKERLENEEFIVKVANNGSEGLRKATEQPPDLILLDITMPDIEGNEVLNKIKERNLQTRVVIVTGTKTSIRDAVRYIRKGACDYYVKDMNIDDLINQIRRALSLESTINFMVSSPAPIIEQSMATVERLSYENDALVKSNLQLENQISLLEKRQNRNSQLTPVIVNLGLLISCVLLALIFCYFVSINEFWIKVLLPLAFFFILKFPIDKLSKIFVKLPASQTNIELHPSSENEENQTPKI